MRSRKTVPHVKKKIAMSVFSYLRDEGGAEVVKNALFPRMFRAWAPENPAAQTLSQPRPAGQHDSPPDAIISAPMTRTAEESPRVAPDVMARYEAVIGLEVHAQLLTQTKL